MTSTAAAVKEALGVGVHGMPEALALLLLDLGMQL